MPRLRFITLPVVADAVTYRVCNADLQNATNRKPAQGHTPGVALRRPVNHANVLTLLPSVSVGLETTGAGVAGAFAALALVPSLSPSASVPPTRVVWIG